MSQNFSELSHFRRWKKSTNMSVLCMKYFALTKLPHHFMWEQKKIENSENKLQYCTIHTGLFNMYIHTDARSEFILCRISKSGLSKKLSLSHFINLFIEYLKIKFLDCCLFYKDQNCKLTKSFLFFHFSMLVENFFFH